MIPLGMLAAAKHAAVSPGGGLVWSAAVSSSAIQITESGKRAARTTTAAPQQRLARAAAPRNTGKLYFEVSIVELAGLTSLAVGVTSDAVPAELSSIAVAGNYAVWRANSQVFQGANYIGAYGADMAVGNVIGVAVNIDSGGIWFTRNGVSIRGNPVAGTTPVATLSAGSLLPSVFLEQVATSARLASLPSFLPAGFTYWGQE